MVALINRVMFRSRGGEIKSESPPSAADDLKFSEFRFMGFTVMEMLSSESIDLCHSFIYIFIVPPEMSEIE